MGKMHKQNPLDEKLPLSRAGPSTWLGLDPFNFRFEPQPSSSQAPTESWTLGPLHREAALWTGQTVAQAPRGVSQSS